MRYFLAAALLAAAAIAQNTGRFADLTAKGLELFERGRYDESINALEEVWEQDQSDSVVAEHLAMGYLYADGDAQRAVSLAEISLAKGGRASFLVQHAHEKLGLLSGEMAEYCNGRLAIVKGRLIFESKDAEHSLTFRPGDVKELKMNRHYGSERGMFHIRTKQKNYNFRPRTSSERETQVLMFMLDKYFKE